jgi:uncharacterized membrane protein YfcA
VIVAALLGVVAGVVSGLIGVGGGILFVPVLVLVLHLSQVNGEATSLLAILPVALVGAWRQRRYGNVRLKEAAIIGALAVGGTFVGVGLANVLPERGLKVGFALLTLATAVQLVRRGLSQEVKRADAQER